MDVTVDLVAPTIETLSPDHGSFTFVAATNVNTIPTLKPGYVVDEVSGGDAQATFNVTVRDAVGGTVQAHLPGRARVLRGERDHQPADHRALGHASARHHR